MASFVSSPQPSSPRSGGSGASAAGGVGGAGVFVPLHSVLRSPESGTAGQRSCSKLRCGKLRPRHFLSCPLLMVVVFGLGLLLIAVAHSTVSIGKTCHTVVESPTTDQHSRAGQENWTAAEESMCPPDKLTGQARCCNQLDNRTRMSGEVWQLSACRELLDNMGYNCERDFCPGCVHGGLCDLECREHGREWGVPGCAPDQNAMCQCLAGPSWVERTVLLVFFGFTLPSLLFPSLVPMARPTTAVVGALLTVSVRHIGSEVLDANVGEYYQKMDWSNSIQTPTIMLLFSLMLISDFMQEIGTFEALAKMVQSESPMRTMLNLCCMSAGLSAILMNDTVCLMFAPSVVSQIRTPGRTAASKFPYLFALCASANIGGALTVVGNPQNNLVYGFADGISFTQFAAYMAIPVLSSIAISIATVWLSMKQTKIDDSTIVERADDVDAQAAAAAAAAAASEQGSAESARSTRLSRRGRASQAELSRAEMQTMDVQALAQLAESLITQKKNGSIKGLFEAFGQADQKQALIELVLATQLETGAEMRLTRTLSASVANFSCSSEQLQSAAMFGVLTTMCVLFVKAADLNAEVNSVSMLVAMVLTVGRGIYKGKGPPANPAAAVLFAARTVAGTADIACARAPV
jgi:hypothetical protein|eukprot:COSAG01_NODE_3456_length_6073_cov_96.792769_1_plen_635_part_00